MGPIFTLLNIGRVLNIAMIAVSAYSMAINRAAGSSKAPRLRGILIFLSGIFISFDLFFLRLAEPGPLYQLLNDIQLGMVPFLLFLVVKDLQATTGMGIATVERIYIAASIAIAVLVLVPGVLSYEGTNVVTNFPYLAYYSLCLVGAMVPVAIFVVWLASPSKPKPRAVLIDNFAFMALYVSLIVAMALDGLDGALDRDHRLIPKSVYAVFALVVYGLVSNGIRVRRIDERTRFLASHDDLTGTLKRADGVARIDSMILERGLGGSPFSVLLVDFNNFRRINDLYGYAAGNRCLREVAERFARALPKDSLLCRMEGDEFMVVAEGVHKGVETSTILSKVFDGIGDPVKLDSMSLKISLRAGVSVFPEHGTTVSVLLRNANDCLIEAKKKIGRKCVAYNDELRRKTIDYYKTEDALKAVLDSKERNEAFLLHYQPKVDKDGRIRGLEGLVRWAHGGEIIAPYRFISVAERSGLINDIGRIVLEKGCRALREWRKKRGWDITISVNIAPSQVEDPRLIDVILETIEANGIEPSSLEIELTESTIMQPSEEERIAQFLGEVSRHGIRTSIDDFGTGYSSFSRIVDLPVNVLKIDRSIAMHTTGEGKSRRVCRSLIQMAHDLGIEVVAEGVDRVEQADFLFSEGCDYIQGFYYFKPLPESEIESLLPAPAPLKSPASS
jgi:diguanylate cyclase (GGDEF)-like protein